MKKKFFLKIFCVFYLMYMMIIIISGEVQNKDRPKVSIIVPVYNTEKWLPECMNSLINQTLEEIQIICVDDGSTDNSRKIIEEYVKKKYHLTIGQSTAEDIKIKIGSAYPSSKKESSLTVTGRNEKGLSSEIKISSSDIREALAKPLEAIAESVKRVLENTPPELSADILDNGIIITGGGALLDGIDLYISNKTSLPVRVADTPLDCVALGAGKFCEL